MRKVSELLEICKEYNYLWNLSADTADTWMMCFAAEDAFIEGAISPDEYYTVTYYCRQIVNSLEYDASTVRRGLGLPHPLLCEKSFTTLKEWWNNHIQDLKEKGE